MSDNSFISEEIRATLERDQRIPHPAEVAITEQRGPVLLRGSVGSPNQRRAAVRIARSVPGVVAVYDELWVDPRDRWQDNEIRGVALQALMASDDVPADRIDVIVANGWLTLKGEVEHQSENNATLRPSAGCPASAGSLMRSRSSPPASMADRRMRSGRLGAKLSGRPPPPSPSAPGAPRYKRRGTITRRPPAIASNCPGRFPSSSPSRESPRGCELSTPSCSTL